MSLQRIFLVRMSPASRSVALAACREALPTAEIVEVDTVEEAGQRVVAGHSQLLVLTEPDAVSAAQAVQAVDPSLLPQWAVVILGRDLAELAEAVPPEQWNVPLLARVFRGALLQHDLLGENLRLRGDLKSVARRIRHDLSTPLGCIATSSHVLKLILAAGDLAAMTDMLENIDESAAELSEIIARVSFLLRASTDPSLPVRVEMGAVVAAVLDQLSPQIRESRAAVTKPASWPQVTGVPPWLHVIWWNLLANALRHGAKGAEIRLAWSPEEGGYRFSVTDCGAGVEPAVQDGLFRPFDQLHLLPAPGLGLSIVQRLVALQGGRCGHERKSDGLSVFYFSLPAAKAGSGRRPRGTRA